MMTMTGALPRSKTEVREMVWRTMEVRGAARFPGTKGRIPDFVGAERAAVHLRSLPAWRKARAVQVNPDAPQLPVRRMALRDGKIVYMAVPRLSTLDCFLELDPVRLGSRAVQAASIKGAERLGRLVPVEAVSRIDLVVCGAVGVNGRGARVGKGGGFSDLEYGLLAEAEKLGPETVIVTTVHALQVLGHAIDMAPHDLPVDVIVTPDGFVHFTCAFPRPRGIYLEALTAEKIAEVPILGRLLARSGRR